MLSEPDMDARGLNISIIIPNYNGRKILEACLPSVIRAAGKAGAEVVVADDRSTDDCVSWLRENHPGVRVLDYQVNAGFVINCNRAINDVECDIFILLNNDVEVEEEFLAPLIGPFSESEDLFAVSPSMLCQGRDMKDEAVNYFEFEHGLIRIRFPCFDGSPPPSQSGSSIGYACGGAAAIDRRKFLELGGFAEIFEPVYFEDADLGYRAWKRGWRIVYEPESVVYHRHRATMGRLWSDWKTRRYATERHFWFTWHNLSDRAMIARHLLWLFRFPLSFIRHRDWPAFVGLFTAFSRLGRTLVDRRKHKALLSDREVMRRARPEQTGP